MKPPNCYRCGKQPCECKDGITLYCGDCREILPALSDVTAVVTDPPYGLTADKKGGTGEASLNLDSPAGRARVTTGGFMGCQWDHGVPSVPYWEAILRVCKPGAMLLAFGGTRTHHRLTCAIEDAGWEIRDCLMWLYGSGFSKGGYLSLRLEKQLCYRKGSNWFYETDDAPMQTKPLFRHPYSDYWYGWASNLKPAFEPIVLAMKPLDGTFAANALEHGVAGINVDGTRISTGDKLGGGQQTGSVKFTHEGWNRPWMENKEAVEASAKRSQESVAKSEQLGRWPANVILSHHPECRQVGVKKVKGSPAPSPSQNRSSGYGMGDKYKPVGYTDADGLETVADYVCHENCPVRLLDEQSGIHTSAIAKEVKITNKQGQFVANATTRPGINQHGDTGGASRFFYCAKSSKRDRGYQPEQDLPLFGETVPEFRNTHPTVKPLDLMRWLLTLVSPPDGGLILDPFAGSGTTLVAAKELGLRAVGIEVSKEYCEIAKERLQSSV